jgi:hypothetical protein
MGKTRRGARGAQKSDRPQSNLFYQREVNEEVAFSGTSIRLFLVCFLAATKAATLIDTNCKTEPSFSHMKRIKNSNRTTMRQDGMKSISLLVIAADLLR